MKNSKHTFTSVLEVLSKGTVPKKWHLQLSECDENLYIIFSLSHYFYRICVLSLDTVYVKFWSKSKDYLFPFWLKNWFFSLNSIKGIKKLPNLTKFLHCWANIGLETSSNFHLFWIKIKCLFAKFNFKITTFSQKWP